MNCVGIDVSKGKSMIAVMRPFGEVVVSPFEVLHTDSELSKLAGLLKSLDGETRVVMESTGNYHAPVAWLLHDAGLYVSVVNAILVHDYGNNSLRRAKTDKKDAVKLANYGLDHWLTLPRYVPQEDTRLMLRTCYRQYQQYSKVQTMLKNNLISLLDTAFPDANRLFASPPRADGSEKWVDFVAAFWHCECVCGLSEKSFVFMKRFTGHTEPWGTFLDVKHWPAIKNPQKYRGQRIVIGSVTDGYLPQEEQFGNTRRLLEQLKGSGAELLICTKSDLVLRDIDLLKEMGKVTVSWSINTLDEDFKADMDNAVSIRRRLDAMKQVYDAGIRTVCFIAPVFPGITDFKAIFRRVKNQCDLVWLENLNLRGGFKKEILDYIRQKRPDLFSLYDAIYNKGDRSYFFDLEKQAEELARESGCPFVNNELPYGRAEPGHPVIVDYFYHEEVRGSENTGRRNTKA